MGKQKPKLPSITFIAAQYHDLLEWAAAGRPYEVCGIIAGKAQRTEKIYHLPNIASDPRTRYVVDPQAFLGVYYEIERAGLDLIGIVHSHPVSAPIPSATDIAEATWAGVFYVIIGFAQDQPEVRAWRLQFGKAEEAMVLVI